jgi:hypothetical protein
MHFNYLELPSLPEHLTQQILDLVERPIQNFHDSAAFIDSIKKFGNPRADEIIDAIVNIGYDSADSLGYPLDQAHQFYNNLASFDFLEVTDEINQWAKNNISKDILHVSIQAMYGGTTVTPHIDEMRSFAYNYVIDSGGDSKTCFYKAKPEFEHLKIYERTIFSKDRLELIEEIRIEPHRWHKINTKTIHAVENLNPLSKRISLSLSFL